MRKEPFSEDARKEMRAFYEGCWKWGFEEGVKGWDYSGDTFLGYYGWLEGNAINKDNALAQLVAPASD